MEIRNSILFICLFTFSCAGNFFPNDEETGEAAKQRCALALIALQVANERGRNCDICLLSLASDCKSKKSGQLIKF